MGFVYVLRQAILWLYCLCCDAHVATCMQADSLNSRYEQNLVRFISGWRGEYEWHQDIDTNLITETRGLRTAMPPQVRCGAPCCLLFSCLSTALCYVICLVAAAHCF